MSETDDDVIASWRDRVGTLRKPGRISKAAASAIIPADEIDVHRGRPPAPERLSAEERGLWERLTYSRRPRWFAGSETLLESFVVATLHCQKLEAAMREAEPIGEGYQRLVRTHRQTTMLCATLATRLRLTPSSKLDKRTPTDGELPVA
jgi:hypothetical protein